MWNVSKGAVQSLTHVQVEGAILFSLISIGDLRLASAIAWQELERHCVFFLRWEFIKENKKACFLSLFLIAFLVESVFFAFLLSLINSHLL